MPQFTPVRTKEGYGCFSFTTGIVYPDTEAEYRKYRSALRNPEQEFDTAVREGDIAFAHWILEHLPE